MERSLTVGSARDVRACIARALLGAEAAEQLGTITLRPHQRTAVSRLIRLLDNFGGALLADAVGLGKTYVALAVARRARAPLVVCPAALVTMWRAALANAGLGVPLVSYEALSRGRAPVARFDLVVLDEAHHARNPATRRYATLAALTSGARVLLLTATPIHNRRSELAALFALFLGARAWRLDDAELAPLIVRRESNVLVDHSLPVLGEPVELVVGDDEATMRAIVQLPPPVPPSDGGDGGALLALALVRQWASSEAALLAALRRRVARADALLHALEQGRHPTRGELAAWTHAEDSIQLALTEIVASAIAPSPDVLLRAIREHVAAVVTLLHRARDGARLDDSRAELLRRIRQKHDGEKIVAFSAFTETVSALYRRLRDDGRVASLTARGGFVASGRLSRREVLVRFVPRSLGVPAPRPAERIDLLLTTDLMSEGINMQDASVVVHLDLPWTPARVEQRIGRSRRLGASHAMTHSYVLAPPAASESVAHVLATLQAKARAAARAIGVAGSILPGIGASSRAEESDVKAREAILARVARWLDADPCAPVGACIAATVRAERSGFLAVIVGGSDVVLIGAAEDQSVTDDPRRLRPLLSHAEGCEIESSAGHVARCAETCERWIARRHAEAASGAALSIDGRSRRLAIRRLARITARLPTHRRPLLLPLAARARHVITQRLGAGAEQVLGQLADAPMPDDAWLRALGSFADIHGSGFDDGPRHPARIVGLLCFRDDS